MVHSVFYRAIHVHRNVSTVIEIMDQLNVDTGVSTTYF